MKTSFLLSPHFFWILLVFINFIIQLLYYYRDRNRNLFLLKKITTPLLLFSGLLIVILHTGGFPLIPCVILAAMGLGELGIEGSSVVESQDGDKDGNEQTPLTVLLAGILFLLVNIFIGGYLIFQTPEAGTLIISCIISILVLGGMLFICFRIFKTRFETRTQMVLYSLGLAVLTTGALTDISRGISLLGWAAAILTVSDSLVLIRMGASFNKSTPSGFRTLLVFLMVILLLYYIYMALLIHMGNPFFN